jgi:hypothetical protein
MFHLHYYPLRTWVRPAWFLLLMAATYLAFEAPYVWMVWWKQIPLGAAQLRPRDGVMLLMCGIFGVLRATSLHPLVWSPYGRWLASTPWQMPKPLPLGPIHLAPRDGVVLVVVMLLLHDANVSLLRVPLVFLFTYLVALAATFAATDCKAFAYAVVFGLGLVVRFWFDPITSLWLAALVYALGYVGLRRSLAGFPWAKPWLTSVAEPDFSSAALEKRMIDLQVKVGWPFDFIRPRQSPSGISTVDGVALSLLLGWWLYCVLANPMPPAEREGIFRFVAIAAFGGIAVRLVRYTQNYRSPIGLWGRMFTLRWIVPGYDKVFVTPIAAAVLFALTFRLPNAWAPGIHISGAFLVAMIAMVLLVGRPSLDEWRHTGSHRIVPSKNAKLLTKV